jgi:glycosyltransferase involved in cell wall biosynthesis
MPLAVVIPVYNHAQYVGKAIESCLNQTRPPDRIVIIDDGSKDDSVAVARSYRHPCIEVHAQENQGAHNTINRAIRMAAETCDLISILNSDDIYELERFATLVPHLEQNPTIHAVVSGLSLINGEGAPLSPDHRRQLWLKAVWSPAQDPDCHVAEWMGLANFAVTSSNIVARRDFLLAHPFKDYRYNHDYYFLAQAAIRDALVAVPDVLLQYRIHEKNTIAVESPSPLMKELLQQHLDLARDLAEELHHSPEMRSSFYRYLRGAAQNVSSFHSGLFQVLLCGLIRDQSSVDFKAAVSALDDEAWPELTVHPNKAHINHWDGRTPLTQPCGLAEKNDALLQQRDLARGQMVAHKSLSRMRQRLLSSRWAALGRALGLGYHWTCDSGKCPEEKIAVISKAVDQSRWLKWGGLTSERLLADDA